MQPSHSFSEAKGFGGRKVMPGSINQIHLSVKLLCYVNVKFHCYICIITTHNKMNSTVIIVLKIRLIFFQFQLE